MKWSFRLYVIEKIEKAQKKIINKYLEKLTGDERTNLIATTTLKSSSSDLLIYFWKSNFVSLSGAKCA